MSDGRTLTTAAAARPGQGLGQPFGATERTDNWRLAPVLQASGLILLFGYATWAAFQGTFFEVLDGGRHYLSPVYSPKFTLHWWPYSPALLALAAPG